MNQTPFTQQERVESLKAGIVSASIAALVFATLLVMSDLLLDSHVPSAWIVPRLITGYSPHWVSFGGSILTIATSGFLFGVMYRYVIRNDTNPQLQSGAVLAFSLVRGLAQIDTGFGITDTAIPFVLMAVESLLVFSCDRIALDQALRRGWVKPFITIYR